MASTVFTAFLFAGTGHAEAAPGQWLNGLTSPALPLEQAGGYDQYHRPYRPDQIYVYDYYPYWYGGQDPEEEALAEATPFRAWTLQNPIGVPHPIGPFGP